MTDNEIIKALECMLGKYSFGEQMDCYGCAFETQDLCIENASEGIVKVALSLINRQKAEIDDLKRDTVPKLQASLQRANKYGAELDEIVIRQRAEIEELEAEIDKQYEQAKADILGNMADGGTSCHWCIDQHRAEAVKEFAERLKTKVDIDLCSAIDCSDYLTDDLPKIIDNLVKEFTEGEGK